MSSTSFVGSIQITYIKSGSAYILYHIDHFDVFTTKWKVVYHKLGNMKLPSFKGVGLTAVGGTIIDDEFFSTVPGLNSDM